MVDGLGNYSQVKPGDVLCLQAGTWHDIKLVNLNGVVGSPITVENTGGKVFITGTENLNGGIEVKGSTYLRITGSGVESHCGSPFLDTDQRCGIEICNVVRGIKVTTNAGDVGHIEIDNIYIHDTSTITDTRGIAIHPLPADATLGTPAQLIDGFYAHHNYVTTTGAEGIYVGTEPRDLPYDSMGKVKNVQVSYNLVENTGYDGIKLKVGIENVSVDHNIIRHAALKNKPEHDAGIQIALSVGQFFNNFVETQCEGIAMGRILLNPGTRYFNNVVVGAQCGGLLVPEAGALVYNNTIVGSGPVGISAVDPTTQVFDNIVAGTTTGITGTVAIPIDGINTNNLIGDIASVKFANPSAGNFHLQPTSPAIDNGRNTGIYPRFDMDGRVRPNGIKTDQGAYEYPLTSTMRIFVPLIVASP
jgi:hypothetical protein